MRLLVRRPLPRRVAGTAGAAVLAVVLTACGSSSGGSGGSSMPGTGHAGMPSATAPSASDPSSAPQSPQSSMPSMPSMDGMAMGGAGDGLSDTRDGYRLTSATATAAAGAALRYRFTVMDPGGAPLTDFAAEQTKRLHFYAIRSDLTGFQHVHPAMAADGMWTADLAALRPGAWRLFATFTPASGAGAGQDFVLSRTVTVPGTAPQAPLPAAARTATADGYTVTVSGDPMAGMAHELAVRITRGGKPVTGLQPYLDSYAHLTAFHAGDQAFAHLHPATAVVAGRDGGPDLTFHTELPVGGDWRLYLQFKAGGALHTAALTLHVR
jgi:hypothetical protein